MIRDVYSGLIFNPKSKSLHPLVNLLVLLVQFLLITITSLIIQTGVLFCVLVELYISKNLKGGLRLIKAILPLLLFLGGVTFLFGGLSQAILVLLRVLIGGLACSFFFSLTNPSDFTRVLESAHIPTRIAIIPSLALTLVPRIAKDAEATFETLYLRGEVQGFFLKWMPKALAIFIAAVLYRTDHLAQSLFFRGLEVQKRIHYRDVCFQSIDFLRGLFWVFFLIIVLCNLSL